MPDDLRDPDAPDTERPDTEPPAAESPAADGPATTTGGAAAGPEVSGLAPLGGLAEPEVPHHTVDPDAVPDDAAVEDSVAYRLAAEDGAPLAPATGADGHPADDPGAGDAAPEFREPGTA